MASLPGACQFDHHTIIEKAIREEICSLKESWLHLVPTTEQYTIHYQCKMSILDGLQRESSRQW